MASVIVMPKLSPTMEEGTLVKWTKKEGDRIAPGDVIAEVETDKANMDFPLEDEGVLLRLLVAEGATVKLGAPVAVLGEAGENADEALAAAGVTGDGAAGPTTRPAATPSVGGTTTEPAPAARETTRVTGERPAKEPGRDVDEGSTEPAAAQARDEGDAPLAGDDAAQPAATGAGDARPDGGRRVRASPLARKIAGAKGVDLHAVTGSGPGGRVVKRDVEEAAGQAPPRSGQPAAIPPATAKAPATHPTAPPSTAEARAIRPPATAATAARPATVAPERGDETLPLSQMRKTIARRVTEAKQTVPHFYLTVDARADALHGFHEQLKAVPRPAGDDGKITLNDLVVKAVAVALTLVPESNASYGEAGIVRHHRVDVGVAVAMEDGLITPIVRDADRKSVGAIAREIRDLAARARTKKLRPEEYTGATFSVSNLGMFGVREFAAIINPPESGILAVGALEKRPVVVTGADGRDGIEIRRMLTLTLSSDHRVMDGALGARLLRAIVEVIEQPLRTVL